MTFVVQLTTEDGTEQVRAIPAEDMDILAQYFDDGIYRNATANHIWTAEEFGEELARYVGHCSVPQKLDSVIYNGTPPSPIRARHEGVIQ